MEQSTQSNPLQGLHKQKLYSLILAGVGLISIFLPWWHISFGGFTAFSTSVNGFHDIGILAFLGFVGAGVIPFVMGDKTKPFEEQPKLITTICFAVAGGIALIQFLREMSYASFGIFLAIAAGVIGALWVWGIIKLPDNSPKA